MPKEDKKPNTIAVFRNRELWERFSMVPILNYGAFDETIRKLLIDPDVKEVRFEKYYDERMER